MLGAPWRHATSAAVALPTLGPVGTPTTIRCTACGTDQPPSARFCPRCGDPRSTDGGTHHVGWRWGLVAGIIGGAVALLVLATLVISSMLDGDLRAPEPNGTDGTVDDAVVELDRGSATTDPAADDATIPDAATATDDTAEAASCRRSDRGRSPCGPELPVGGDTADALLLVHEGSAVVRLGDVLVGIELPEGSERWRTEAFRGARAVRATSDDELLVASVTNGLVAVDHRSGAIRWTVDFAAVPADDGPAALSTTSIVEVPVWLGDDGVLARDPTGRLLAFDREDGENRWVQPVDARTTLATAQGLLVVGRDGLRLWRADEPTPRWQRSGSDLRLHRAVGAPAPAIPPEPAAAPLPLTSGRWLVDLDGGLVAVGTAGPVDVVLAGEVTVAVSWPGAPNGDAGTDPGPGEGSDEDRDDAARSDLTAGSLATLTAFDATGEVRWQQRDVPLPCCAVRTVPAASGELAVTTRGDEAAGEVVVLDTTDGRVAGLLRRDGASLEALTRASAVWRQDTGLVALDRRTGREAFRATGTVVSADPLVLQGPRSSIVVRADGPIAPSDVARPGSRRGPDPSGSQGRGTAS
jgi:outer membrane protein assembly factor BamB